MAQETPPNGPPVAQVREHQLRFVVNVLLRRWVMILTFTLTASLGMGGWGLLWRVEPHQTFRAQAKVLAAKSSWDKGILRGVGGPPLIPADALSIVRRTSKKDLAEKVARALVQQDILDGQIDSGVVTEEEYAARAASIGNRIKIQVEDPDSGVILIESEDCATPEEATRLAEFAARVFVKQNRQSRLEEERETHEALLGHISQLQQQLYQAETDQWEFKKDMDFQTYGKVGDELNSIYKELSEKNAMMEETRAKLTEIQTQLKANRQHLPQALGNVTDSVVNDLLGDLDALLREQLDMSVVFQPEFPGLQEIQDEISEKKDAILEAVRRLDEGMGGGASIWRQRQNLYRQQLDLRLTLTGLEIRIASLKRLLEDLIPRIPELANENLKYDRLENEAARIRELFNKLRTREFEIRSALSRETGQVERHESVVASAMPLGGGNVRARLNFVIGALVGLVVGFALAVMLEIMDTSIQSIDDVATYLGLEVIGTIPKMKFGNPKRGHRRRGAYVATVDEDQIDACIVTQHDPKSPVSEAYRTLRTNFQFATLQNPPQTIMVTSAVPGEGKTTTAVNMAVTMADCGIRVLLVDTDLRRPNVHRVLKMERGPGLADVLRGEADLPAVIRRTRVENLWIISSGRVPPNPSELMGSERMAKLMEQLGGDFDLVVCDAPSILVVTDPVLLSTHVDTVVIVISVRNARRETIQRAHKLLQAAQVSIAGIVLNGLEATRRHYYYYYYYYEDGQSQRRRFNL
ncbi:MAG: polysaccharide biosynthesis tyrosine autokinase [Nitrospiraceae bacterium]|nr:polysaccharide biosynthesis tyrosine autokinase [Nitrospiraceae bacterium]